MTNYLVTYKADGEFMAEFMNIKQIADLYGCSDINDTTDHKVYRLSPDKEPEQLILCEEWVIGSGHMVRLWDPNDEPTEEVEDQPIDEWKVIEH